MSTEVLAALQQLPTLEALWFAVAIALLGYFDISLPRGDSVGVTGALEAAALLALGFWAAVPVILGAALVAMIARHLAGRGVRVLSGLASRVAGLVAVAVLLRAVEGASLGGWAKTLGVIAVYVVAEMLARQTAEALRSRRSLRRQVLGGLSLQAPLVLAQFSTAALVAVVYPHMQSWSLVTAVALLLLIRQSYRLLLGEKETYRMTVEVLVEAAEAADVNRHGHAERTASIARAIAIRCSFPSKEIERVSYAALLHDIARIREQGAADYTPTTSSQLLEGVDFFEDVVRVMRVFDGHVPEEASASAADVRAAFVVGLASDIDDAAHGAYGAGSVSSLADIVPWSVKASAVGAALSLGYQVPAVR
ncbi:MAG: hypothetical protein U1E26_09335 [Coriobacteriia bacterium]|nr:hypothetical protein [Coriobacteriia bacterium]